LIVCPFVVNAIPACVSGLVNWNDVYFDMADWLATLVHDSSMDAAKTVKTVYGTFVIVRRCIQRGRVRIAAYLNGGPGWT